MKLAVTGEGFIYSCFRALAGVQEANAVAGRYHLQLVGGQQLA